MEQRRAQGGTDESVMVAYNKVAKQKSPDKKDSDTNNKPAEPKEPILEINKEEAEKLLDEVEELEEKNMKIVMDTFKKIMKGNYYTICIGRK